MTNFTASSQPSSRWRKILVATSLFYVATFLLWRALVASPINHLWWLQVSEVFGMLAYLPVPFLLLGAIVQRSRLALLGLILPLLWFGIEYGALFMPAPNVAHADNDAPTLRVMSANVMRSIGFGKNAVPELQAVADSAQPDIILLQEAGPASLTQLQALADDYPYQIAGLAGTGVHVAAISKWPIVSGEVVEARDGCHCIRMTLAWEDQLIDVLAVHVIVPYFDIDLFNGIPRIRDFDARRQDVIFDALLDESATSPRPLLIVGDFNTNEREPNYERLLQAGLHNAHDESGWGIGLTFPRPGAIRPWWRLPLLRIDHLFYSEHWRAERTWTGLIQASDHLYVVADLELRVP